MNVCGIELTQQATEIYEDIKSKIDFNYVCTIGETSSVKQVAEHQYQIELCLIPEDIDKFSFIFIHEIGHIYQIETGYKRILRSTVEDVNVSDLLKHISNFVLDTNINEMLIQKYNYNIRNITDTSHKYQEYCKMLEAFPEGSMNEWIEKKFTLECAYIYFNNEPKYALDLVGKAQLYAPKLSDYFWYILNQYAYGNVLTSDFTSAVIVNLCHVFGLDDCYLLV